MPIQQQTAPVRSLESLEEFSETRLEAIGFIFHGTIAIANGKPSAGRAIQFATLRPLHKLEKVGENETKIWFRSVRVAIKHLDELVGHPRWKWCKVCEREITQRILDEI